MTFDKFIYIHVCLFDTLDTKNAVLDSRICWYYGVELIPHTVARPSDTISVSKPLRGGYQVL